MLAGVRATRSMAVALAVLGQMFLAPGLVLRLPGSEGRPGSPPARLHGWLLSPGSSAPSADESSPAESDGPASDSEDAPGDADGSLQKAEHSAPPA